MELHYVCFTGTIVNVTYDNLGGNVALGFAKSLSAIFFCRMCLCTKSETQALSIARPSKYRTKTNYDQIINTLKGGQKLDLKAARGIADYCVLNDLRFFHIIENWTADVMHDLCEGSVVTLLDEFFSQCVLNKVISDECVQGLIAFYDYGVLNRHFLPSQDKKDRKNRNQNASQTKTLIHHIPFIFYAYRNEESLKQSWECINYMIKIIRICYSNTIKEIDLIELEQYIKCYLDKVVECHGRNLKPKDHFLTHYPEIIRRSGPLVHMSTMRFEMKHKQLTKVMKNKQNFRNVTKTIASHVQQRNVFREVYVDKIEHSKLLKLEMAEVLHYQHMNLEFGGQIRKMKSLHFNNDYYEEGLIFKHLADYYEIKHILLIGGKYVFLCLLYDRIRFDDFLVSLEIRKSARQEPILFQHSELIYSKTHDKKILGEKIYILADSLELK